MREGTDKKITQEKHEGRKEGKEHEEGDVRWMDVDNIPLYVIYSSTFVYA